MPPSLYTSSFRLWRAAVSLDSMELRLPAVAPTKNFGMPKAADEFLLSMVGLHQNDGTKTEMRLNYPRVRKLTKGENAYSPTCLHCGAGRMQ